MPVRLPCAAASTRSPPPPLAAFSCSSSSPPPARRVSLVLLPAQTVQPASGSWPRRAPPASCTSGTCARRRSLLARSLALPALLRSCASKRGAPLPLLLLQSLEEPRASSPRGRMARSWRGGRGLGTCSAAALASALPQWHAPAAGQYEVGGRNTQNKTAPARVRSCTHTRPIWIWLACRNAALPVLERSSGATQ